MWALVRFSVTDFLRIGGTVRNALGEFPDSPVVKTLLSLQRAWVQSLVKKLRSHKLHSTAKKKKVH